MAETIDEVSYNYEDDGKLVRRELKKDILTRGSWATVMFLYQELNRQDETWGEPKVSIVRFKKSGGVYRKQSSFNVSSRKQANQIIDVIQRWYGELDAAGGSLPVPARPETPTTAVEPEPGGSPPHSTEAGEG